MTRPTVSTPPPAGYATTSETVREGYSSAVASRHAAAVNRTNRVTIGAVRRRRPARSAFVMAGPSLFRPGVERDPIIARSFGLGHGGLTHLSYEAEANGRPDF